MNEDVETAREIWTDIIKQVPKLPPETFANVITGLPPAIRQQLTGAHPTIKKALELLGEPIQVERNPEFTAQTEMQIVFSYAPDTLLQAAWEMLQEPDKKKLNKQAVPKKPLPNGSDAFATLQGLGRVSNTPWMNDYYGAQMQAGEDCDKKGYWLPNSQGEKTLRKEYPRGGTSTALIRGLDAAEAMNNQLRQEVLERLGPFTLDVSLAFTAALCDPRNKVYPLQGAVLVTTKKILAYKKFQQRGERREEMERKVEQAVKDLQRLRIRCV